jgi:uncharacterized repeat protein (TIGR03803 family)
MIKLNWCMRACALFLLWATTAVALPAQTFKTLHSFDNTDGSYPVAGLVQGTDGNLYGTTSGTVFTITPSGMLTTLHSFDGTDGAFPNGLTQGTDGNFYGTTRAGGAYDHGDGTVFTITPSGMLTSLYSFCPNSPSCTDGYEPVAGLVQGTDGNFYGTTQYGGANDTCGLGCGTVFEITPGGALTTLYSFCSQSNCTDGRAPFAGLVQGTDGNFYGTTVYGGANDYGTVFKITASGVLTTLYSFCSQGGGDCTDGFGPVAVLVQATDGNFYGPTESGGANGVGTVFKITPGGALTTLYSFCSQSNCTDGFDPEAGLVQAASVDGNFYGTTPVGGANCIPYAGCGTIFKITPSGTLTTLHSFCSHRRHKSCTDGYEPAGLVQDTNGKFYGTTLTGGANNDGTVFSLSVGLGPFVETNPTSGMVGAAVNVLGTNLTGATSVTFNGTAATFKVVSKSEITTTVPTGATTGTVQVVTPTRTLKSNVSFRVTP